MGMIKKLLPPPPQAAGEDPSYKLEVGYNPTVGDAETYHLDATPPEPDVYPFDQGVKIDVAYSWADLP